MLAEAYYLLLARVSLLYLCMKLPEMKQQGLQALEMEQPDPSPNFSCPIDSMELILDCTCIALLTDGVASPP